MKKVIIFILLGYILLTSERMSEYLEPSGGVNDLIKVLEENGTNQYQKHKNNLKVIGIKLTEYLG